MKSNDISLLGETIFSCFFVAWIVLVMGGLAAVFLSKDAAFKRWWFPRLMISGGFFMISLPTTIMVLQSKSLKALSVLVVLVPMVSLFIYLNIKSIKFCDRCGATCREVSWFSRIRFCSWCGAELEAKPKPDIDPLE
jgi:hypothetical protein